MRKAEMIRLFELNNKIVEYYKKMDCISINKSLVINDKT